jgi:hypothetical protein
MEKNKEYYEALDKRTNEFKDWKKSQSIEPNETVDTTDKWEGIANEVTQANLQAKHEDKHQGWQKVVHEEITKSNPILGKETNKDGLTQQELTAKHEANPTIETTIGAGDVVEKITTVTGIKAIVKAFTPEGEDCGCDKRKEKMNELPILKRKKSVKCLTVEEYNFMDGLNLFNNGKVSGKDVKSLQVIYQRVFNVKGVSSCAGCSFAKKLDELKAVLETYK